MSLAHSLMTFDYWLSTPTAGDNQGNYGLILWNLDTGQPIRTLSGHTGTIRSVAYSPDGRQALSLASNGQLILWNLETGEKMRKYAISYPFPSIVAFGPDGRTALVGTQVLVILLDLGTGTEIHTFMIAQTANDVAFSPDGRAALYGSNDASVGLFDLETYTLEQSFVGHLSAVQAVAFSADGRYVLSGGVDPFLILWDAATGETIRRWTLPASSTVNSLTFSPDGQTALSGLADGLVVLWNVESGEPLARFTGHFGAVRCVRFSPDGSQMYSTGLDGTLRQWALPPRSAEEWIAWAFANRYARDLSDKEQQFYDLPADRGITSLRRYYLTAAPVSAPAALVPLATPTPASLPADRFAAQIGDNRGIIAPGGGQVWTYTGRADELLIIEALADQPSTGVYDFAQQVERGLLDTWLAVYGPDGAQLAENDDFRGVRDNNARVDVLLPQDGTYVIQVRGYSDLTAGAYTLSVQNVQIVRERSRVEYHDGEGVWGVGVSPDGQRTLSSRGASGLYVINATEKQDKSFTLWDISGSTVRELRTFNQNGEVHNMSVTGLTFCPGRRIMLSSSWDGSIGVWDTDTEQVLQKLVGHQYIPWPVCSPDEKTVASSSYDGTVRLWNLSTGEELRRLDLGAPAGGLPAFSPDGQTVFLAAYSFSGLIQWDLNTGEKATFADHETMLNSVAISPDGRWLAADDMNFSITLWDRATRQEVRRFEGHHSMISAMPGLIFTPDSRHLLSASWDGTMRLWNVATGQEEARFLGHQSGVWSIGLSADGRTVVSGSFDGTMRIWDMPELMNE